MTCAHCKEGFLGSSDSEEPAHDPGDLSSIPGLGRSPGEVNCYPLQYSSLENSVDRGVWQATVHGAQRFVHNSVTNTHTHTHTQQRADSLEKTLMLGEIEGKRRRGRWR